MTMIATLWQAFRARLSFAPRPDAGARLRCFHCHEPMSAAQVVLTRFDGAERQVCCHGCAAVLQVVQENGMTDAYRAERNGR